MNRGTQFNIFEAGFTLTDPSEIVHHVAKNRFYTWGGEYPKTVTEGTTPEGTGGIFPKGGWVGVDSRSALEELKAGDGSNIGVGMGYTLADKMNSSLSAADYGFIGELKEDMTERFNDLLRTALRAGIRVVDFPIKTSFSINEAVPLYKNTVLTGNATITSTNPDNRYIKCHKNISQPLVDFVTMGDLTSFANSKLLSKYLGNSIPKVVFIGDSLLMGGQHRNDFTGLAERLKHEINTGVGVDCDFYNRAIAGSAVGEFLGKIPTYANINEVHGNGEAAWVTDKGRTWFSYIKDIQPDLVVVAFGMNAPNANDTHNCLKVRELLKGLSSNPSIIWVTSPMRTIDTSKTLNGTSFGTYPSNEYSNTAGLSYGAYGRWVGDTVIDSNLASSITMLGIDPTGCSLTKDTTDDHEISSGSTYTSNNGVISATIATGGILRGNLYQRDGAVSFKITSLDNVIRVRARNDINSVNCVYLDVSSTEIRLYAPTPSTGTMGLIASKLMDTVNKTVRLHFIGSTVLVIVDDILQLKSSSIYASRFMSLISIQSVAGSAAIKECVFYKPQYRTNVPLLTPEEIFSPDYGLGGNLLNHPNTLANQYIYGAALNGFGNKLKSHLADNISITKREKMTLAPNVSGSVVVSRVGNIITIMATDIDGSLPAYSNLCTLPITYYPQDTVYSTGISIAVNGGIASSVGVRLGVTGNLVLTHPLPKGSAKVGFAITFSRDR